MPIVIRTYQPLELLEKAKYTKRWKGSDGKWRYEYGSSSKAGKKSDSVSEKNRGKNTPLSPELKLKEQQAKKVLPGFKLDRVLKRRVDFSVNGKEYTLSGSGVIAKRSKITEGKDAGKNWYSYQLDIPLGVSDQLIDIFAGHREYNYKQKRTDAYFK